MSAHERFLADIRQYPDFRKDPALALELVRKMQGGDKESEAHLIASALKLIAEVTKRHCARWNAWQSEEDLRQEASQNVAAKISKFNPKKATLEAYIRFCSRMAFIRFWYDQQAIHLSDSRRKVLAHISKARRKLESQLGREPTLEEISACVDLDEEQVEAIGSSAPVLLVNLDENCGDEGASNVLNFPELTAKTKSPLELAEIAELRRILVEALGDVDASLLLAYEGRGTAYFQDLYITFKHKCMKESAARKWAQRQRDKVAKYIERRGRRTD